MKASTKRFKKVYIKRRDRIEKQGVRLFKALIASQYKDFLSASKKVTPDKWVKLAEKIPEKPVRNVFLKFYPMSAPLAMLTHNHLINQKAEGNIIWENVYAARLKTIVATDCAKKITSITGTTQKRVIKVVQDVLIEAEEEGFGVAKIRSKLFKQLNLSLEKNGYARALNIAQTEMIGASNTASHMAALNAEKITGGTTVKFWSTSGLGSRATHQEAQDYSDRAGGLKMDEPYPNGLLHPGDPSGGAKEVCNCRCTELHEMRI